MQRPVHSIIWIFRESKVSLNGIFFLADSSVQQAAAVKIKKLRVMLSLVGTYIIGYLKLEKEYTTENLVKGMGIANY